MSKLVVKEPLIREKLVMLNDNIDTVPFHPASHEEACESLERFLGESLSLPPGVRVSLYVSNDPGEGIRIHEITKCSGRGGTSWFRLPSAGCNPTMMALMLAGEDYIRYFGQAPERIVTDGNMKFVCDPIGDAKECLLELIDIIKGTAEEEISDTGTLWSRNEDNTFILRPPVKPVRPKSQANTPTISLPYLLRFRLDVPFKQPPPA